MTASELHALAGDRVTLSELKDLAGDRRWKRQLEREATLALHAAVRRSAESFRRDGFRPGVFIPEIVEATGLSRKTVYSIIQRKNGEP